MKNKGFQEVANVHEFALESGAAYITEAGRAPVYLFNAERLAAMIQKIMLASVEHVYEQGRKAGAHEAQTRSA